MLKNNIWYLDNALLIEIKYDSISKLICTNVKRFAMI